MSWKTNPGAAVAVFNGTAPTGWTNLDLSATVGAAAVGVLLKVEIVTGYPYIAFRTDGDASNYYVPAAGPQGMVMLVPNSGTSDTCLVFLPTSAAGIIEWIAQSGQTVRIYVLGWADLDVANTVLLNGDMPSVYTSVDLSAHLAAEGFAFIRYVRDGGSAAFVSLRPADASEDGLVGLNAYGGIGEATLTTIALSSLLGVVTNAARAYQHIAGAPVPQVDATLLGHFETVRDRTTLFATAAPPVAWTTLSTGLSERSLCILKVVRGSVGSTNQTGVAFRAADDASDYLPGSATYQMGCACAVLQQDKAVFVLCECDASGDLEWIASVNTYAVSVELVGHLGTVAPVTTITIQTGAQPLGSDGPYPVIPALRAQGYLWRDELLSRYLSAKVGLAVTASPTFAHGLVLDGASQYGKYANQAAVQHFGFEEQFWVIVFTPDFAADADAVRVLFDTDTGDYGVRHLDLGDLVALRVTVAGTDIDIAYGAYQASWRAAQRNVLLVNADMAGNTETYLNGTLVDSTATALTPTLVDEVYLGVDAGVASGFFDGTIHALRCGLGGLAVADVYPEAA